MPSPFDVETGTVLMHEPSWAKEGQLRAQLLDETYPKPFVIDDGKSRFLYFNVRLMQSEMSLKAPNDLAIRYTQKMMAFALPATPQADCADWPWRRFADQVLLSQDARHATDGRRT
jgi:hypothetical protein